jgi:hypothetical protein
MLLSCFTWITTALCLIGTVLNVKKNSLCFWLWSVGNIAWLIFDIHSGLYSRALLDIVQLGFAIWGIIEWRKK